MTETVAPPLERHAVIEADQFCTCGYNLHGQRIARDERLGFMVVRCPECGTWHAAGHGSTATRPWLRRLAAVLLAIWGLLLLGVGAATMLALLGTGMGYVDTHTTYAQVEQSTGRLVGDEGSFDPQTSSYNARYVYIDTGEPVPNGQGPSPAAATRLSRAQVPFDVLPPEHASRQRAPTWRTTAGFALGVAIAGFVLGVLQAGALWHLVWPAKLVPPLVVIGLSAGIVAAITLPAEYWRPARPVLWQSLLIVHGITFASWIVGLLIGRPVFRTLTRLLVPPKPRQALAFLWHADGKDLPA